MLRHYRRFWIALAAALLAAPFGIGILAPQADSMLADELRTRAILPGAPNSVSDWRSWPVNFDAYLRDHFGLRREMIRAYSIIAHRLLSGGNAQVQVGRNGWLFYRGDDMLQQSAGLLVRAPRVEESASTIADIRDSLAERGIGFVFASPPNSATIHPEHLPAWVRNRNRRTEYDLMLEMLAARGVQAVDLRAALRVARSEGAVYRKYDTHWTLRGALAAFNATAAAVGRTDWQLDATAALGPPIQISGGDLARMLGIAEDVVEQIQLLTLQRGQDELFSPQPFATFYSVLRPQAGGETLLIIGDSFTAEQLPPMVLANAWRFAWTHHKNCGFDWKWIDEFRPNQVWWMPTERYILCGQGVRPSGMPKKAISPR